MNMQNARAFLAATIAAASLFNAAAVPRFTATFTVDGYDGETTLANFPVLVRIAEYDSSTGRGISGFSYDDCAPGGRDIAFMDNEGNGLDREIDSWTPGGESFVWVRLPTLSHGTSFIMTYGDSSVDAQPACQTDGSVWAPAGYAGVWHMNEANAMDSSANHLDGTADASITVVDAKIGAGTSFPNNAKIETTNTLNSAFSSAISFETWVRPSDVIGSQALFGKTDLATFKIDSGKTWFTTPGNTDFKEVNYSVSTNTWYHLVITFVPRQAAKVYVNGALSKTQADNGSKPGFKNLSLSCPIVFGSNQWNQYYKGVLDECRILPVELSADWIAASYATQADAGFLICGGAQDFSCAVILNEDANGGTSVRLAPSILHLAYGLEEGESATLKIQYGTAADALTETITAAGSVTADGRVPVTVKGLARGTTYYFKAVLELPDDSTVESEVLSVTTISDYETAMRRIEYIEGNGTQYIDSGYYPGPNTHAKADYQFTATMPQYRVFGIEGGDFSYQCYINTSGYWAYTYADVASGNFNPVSGNISADTERHLFDFNYIDGESNRAYTIYGTNGVTATQSPLETTGATKNASLSLVIAGMRSSATEVKCIAKHRIYSVQLDEGAALTAAFAPVVRAFDGAVGLYDSARNRFLPSASAVSYVAGPAISTIERFTGATLAAVDLTFIGAPMARTLKVAYGSGFGGDDPADWDVTETVATIPAGATSYSVTAFPANWGSDDACVLRCYFDDGTSFPLWSDAVIYREASEPIITGVTVDGTGGDTLVVRGNLSYFPGDDCTLSVRVTKSGGSPVVWSGLAGATLSATGDFTLTLHEADTTAARYIEPGAAYTVVVEGTSGEAAGSSSAVAATTAGAPQFLSSGSSVSQRRGTFTGNLSDLGVGGSATVTLYVGETQDALAAVETPLVRTATGEFSIAHTFDTFEKTYYWQLGAVATTAGGRTLETRTDVASCKTLDTTTYTWQAVDGNWNGDWEDSTHWSPNNADCLGYPQSSAATVDFKNCTTDHPVVVKVNGTYTVGTFKCYGSAASDIAFVGTGVETSGLTGGGYSQSKIASDSTLEFRDMALTLNGDWELLRNTDRTNVTFRLSGVTGQTTGYFALAAGYCRAEFLNGTDFAGGKKFNIGGTNTVVVIDNSTIRANGSPYGFIFNADSNNWGGMEFHFRGKAPQMLSSKSFYPFEHHPDINHQFIFEVPAGGYAEAPIQFTHASAKMFQGGHATADYHVVISPDSPALKSREAIEGNTLIYASAGFNLTETKTMDFAALPRRKGDAGGSLVWAEGDGTALDGFGSAARMVLLNLDAIPSMPLILMVQ